MSEIPAAQPTDKGFSKSLAAALGAFVSALVGFGAVLLAMHWHSLVLLMLGVAGVVIGIAVGICAMLYGWWSLSVHPWLHRRRHNF